MLEKTLESPLDCKEIQPVHPKGDQSWVFIGRTDVEAETPILWPPDEKSWLIWKDHDAGKDWGQEEKGTTEDETVGWHHQLNGYGFWVDSGSWWWTGRPGVLQFMGSQSQTWLSDWTELNYCVFSLNILIADFSEVVFYCPHCWYLFCVPFSFLFSFLLLCYRLFSNIWLFLWRRLEYTIPKYALWHKNYFEQKAIENQQIEEKSSILSFLPEGRI